MTELQPALDEKAARLFGQFRYAACTVYARLKPSVLFHVRGEANLDVWEAYGEQFVGYLGLCCRVIDEGHCGTALLIYRPELLDEALSEPRCRCYLGAMGYDVKGGTEQLVDELARRYQGASYPHEIGFFLGYPAHDVAGYIEHGGEHCVACRYWKVYDDIEGATELFRRFDHCKKAATALLVPCARPSI